MKLTFSSEITAADSARRIISGKIAPIGEVGHTSAGKVIFERGSIQIDDPKKVLFLEEHNDKVRLGRAQSIEATEDGWYGTFKLSASTKATDALIEASEGLKTGMSVGVEVIDSRPTNGVIHVLAAKLIEECGLKGYRVGNAEVSDKHANFIINLGKASAKDIEDIIDHVESEVFKRKGIKLEREVKILGDFLN